jgi:hypothetical protein
MSKLEYLLTFLSIIIALGVSDILISLHRMLKIRDQIRWHWIPLAWAAILMMAILNIWFAIHFYLDDKLSETAAGFIFILLPIIFVLLLCMAIFPDHPDKEEKDLLKWYFNNKNYIFVLFVLNWISFNFIKVFQQLHDSVPFKPQQLTLLIPVVLYAILISSRKVWIHSILTGFYFVIFVLTIIDTRMVLA